MEAVYIYWSLLPVASYGDLNTASIKRKETCFRRIPGNKLLDARQRREDARKLLANDVDPGAVRKARNRPIFKKRKH